MRFKIESRRGIAGYFADLETLLKKRFSVYAITTAPLTGSLLIAGDQVDIETIIRFGEEHSLFTINKSVKSRKPLINSVGDPIVSASKKINELSDGFIDMPGIVFISALMFGAYEIIRGNFRSPPWYTAFWYAFGMYSQSYFSSKSADHITPEPLSD